MVPLSEGGREQIVINFRTEPFAGSIKNKKSAVIPLFLFINGECEQLCSLMYRFIFITRSRALVMQIIKSLTDLLITVGSYPLVMTSKKCPVLASVYSPQMKRIEVTHKALN